jgi:hypothetical protein
MKGLESVVFGHPNVGIEVQLCFMNEAMGSKTKIEKSSGIRFQELDDEA